MTLQKCSTPEMAPVWHAGSCSSQSLAITGGTGALGSLVGSWAAALGASHTSLLSRSKLDNSSSADYSSASSQISITLCDVTLQEDVSSCLGSSQSTNPGPQHVLHASEPRSYAVKRALSRGSTPSPIKMGCRVEHLSPCLLPSAILTSRILYRHMI